MKPGTLYLIPAALGTPQETGDPFGSTIPPEVRHLTAELPYFIAENAKTARAHLKQVARTSPLGRPLQEIRIAELNVRTTDREIPELLAPLMAGEDGGLISEAGVPAVADPGARLVEMAHAAGITVRPLVGPSSILLALMASGLNGQNFAFNGYLPTSPAERSRQIRQLEGRSAKEQQTQIFIETPYRNQALLGALCENCRDSTRLCVATDLTLPTEAISTHAIRQWKQLLATGKIPDIQRRPSIFLFLAD